MPHTNTEAKSTSIGTIAEIVIALCSLVALTSALFVIPYRLEASEKKMQQFETTTDQRLKVIEAQQATDRERQVRIEERLKSVQRALAIPTD
jgi:hypothetical protein